MTQKSFLAEYLILCDNAEESAQEHPTKVFLIRKATGERIETNIFSSSRELGESMALEAFCDCN